MTITQSEIDDLRAKLEKAVRGPWRVGPTDDAAITAADGSEIATIDGDYNEPDLWPTMEANAALIVAAINALPALLDLASRGGEGEAERADNANNANAALVLSVPEAGFGNARAGVTIENLARVGWKLVPISADLLDLASTAIAALSQPPSPDAARKKINEALRQLGVSDNYALDHAPSPLPSVWEIQNNHVRARLKELLELIPASAIAAREGAETAVADWMIDHSIATGHGDTLDDLLCELRASAREETIREAAEICAAYSKKWQAKVANEHSPEGIAAVESAAAAGNECRAAILSLIPAQNGRDDA